MVDEYTIFMRYFRRYASVHAVLSVVSLVILIFIFQVEMLITADGFGYLQYLSRGAPSIVVTPGIWPVLLPMILRAVGNNTEMVGAMQFMMAFSLPHLIVVTLHLLGVERRRAFLAGLATCGAIEIFFFSNILLTETTAIFLCACSVPVVAAAVTQPSRRNLIGLALISFLMALCQHKLEVIAGVLILSALSCRLSFRQFGLSAVVAFVATLGALGVEGGLSYAYSSRFVPVLNYGPLHHALGIAKRLTSLDGICDGATPEALAFCAATQLNREVTAEHSLATNMLARIKNISVLDAIQHENAFSIKIIMDHPLEYALNVADNALSYFKRCPWMIDEYIVKSRDSGVFGYSYNIVHYISFERLMLALALGASSVLLIVSHATSVISPVASAPFRKMFVATYVLLATIANFMSSCFIEYSGGEHPRYFVTCIPYIIILAALVLDRQNLRAFSMLSNKIVGSVARFGR
jgi:hypothetical protein